MVAGGWTYSTVVFFPQTKLKSQSTVRKLLQLCFSLENCSRNRSKEPFDAKTPTRNTVIMKKSQQQWCVSCLQAPTRIHSETVWGKIHATGASLVFMFDFASAEQKTFFISPQFPQECCSSLGWWWWWWCLKQGVQTHICMHQRKQHPNYTDAA